MGGFVEMAHRFAGRHSDELRSVNGVVVQLVAAIIRREPVTWVRVSPRAHSLDRTTNAPSHQRHREMLLQPQRRHFSPADVFQVARDEPGDAVWAFRQGSQQICDAREDIQALTDAVRVQLAVFQHTVRHAGEVRHRFLDGDACGRTGAGSQNTAHRERASAQPVIPLYCSTASVTRKSVEPWCCVWRRAAEL